MAITINGDGTLTGVSVGGLPDGIVDTDMLATDAVSAAKLQSTAIVAGDLPSGSILQVKTTIYDTFTSQSVAAGTFQDLPFSVTITPSSTDSKILVSSCLMGQWSNAGGHNSMFTVNRKIGSTNNRLAPSGDVGSRNRGLMGAYSHNDADAGSSTAGYVISNYLDSPSTTSEITYIPVLRSGNTGYTWYINQNATAGTSGDYERGVSWITVMEVAG